MSNNTSTLAGQASRSIEPVSAAVVSAVAAATDTEPTDLPPLYHAIEPDALDKLFPATGRETGVQRVSFTMAGCEVVVEGADRVQVTPAESSDGSEDDE